MKIIVTGSIAYDYLMRFPGKFTDYILPDQLHELSVSFLVDEMSRQFGGNGGNIAYSTALFGLQPMLMGTVGRDFEPYRQWLDTTGVDTSTVRQLDEVFTASFFVNTDNDNNQIASFYGGAMFRATEFALADVYEGKPDVVIIAPNAPEAMVNLAQECRDRDIRYIFDPSQQLPRLSGDDLNTGIDGAYMLVVNAYEAGIIQDKTGRTVDDLRAAVDIFIVTQGEKGSHIYTNGERIEIDAFPPTEIVDPTGVGDAYRAGLLCGLAYDWDFKLAGEVGALCATYALEHVGPQNHHFTLKEFVERFRTHFDDDGVLDRLSQS